MNLEILKKSIHDNAVKKGFWDVPHNFGNDLMLVVSELGECVEAHRTKTFADLEAFEKSDLPFKDAFKKHIKDGVEDELADAIIRLLDICEGYDIDIVKHIELKMKYNSKREKLHGKQY